MLATNNHLHSLHWMQVTMFKKAQSIWSGSVTSHTARVCSFWSHTAERATHYSRRPPNMSITHQLQELAHKTQHINCDAASLELNSTLVASILQLLVLNSKISCSAWISVGNVREFAHFEFQQIIRTRHLRICQALGSVNTCQSMGPQACMRRH